MNIFVAKLNFRTTSEALEDLFAEYGTVDSAKVILDRDTGKSKGYAFVEMPDDEDAMTAINSLNETEFDGHTIVVKKSEPRGNGGRDSRRNSGGGGGFKPRNRW